MSSQPLSFHALVLWNPTLSSRDFVGLHNFLKGVSVDASMIGGVTPLQIAVEKHDVEMVAYLLSAGACPERQTGAKGKPTAFDLAKRLHKQAQASKEMIAKTADVVRMFEDETSRAPILENLQITIDEGVKGRCSEQTTFLALATLHFFKLEMYLHAIACCTMINNSGLLVAWPARRDADALFAKRLFVLVAIMFGFWLLFTRYEEQAAAIFGPELVMKTQNQLNSIGTRFQKGLSKGIWEKLQLVVTRLTASLST